MKLGSKFSHVGNISMAEVRLIVYERIPVNHVEHKMQRQLHIFSPTYTKFGTINLEQQFWNNNFEITKESLKKKSQHTKNGYKYPILVKFQNKIYTYFIYFGVFYFVKRDTYIVEVCITSVQILRHQQH